MGAQEGTGRQVVDLHVAGHGSETAGANGLAHDFVEQRGDDAAVQVAGVAFECVRHRQGRRRICPRRAGTRDAGRWGLPAAAEAAVPGTWAMGVRVSFLPSFLPLQLPCQHILIDFTVHVAAGENDADPLAAPAAFLFERGGQRGGACALGQVVRVLVVDAHGLGNFSIGDFDDAGDVGSR